MIHQGAAPLDARQVRIRPAGPGDCPFILGLAARLDAGGLPPWHDPDKFHAFHQEGIDHTAAAVLAIDAGRVTDHAVFLAEASGRDGAIPLGVLHLKDDHSFLTGESQGYIEVLAITQEAEGRGVGWALMRAAEGWARGRGHRLLALDTAGVNAHARAFYRRCEHAEEVSKYVKVLEAGA